jgi:hypothetical protein
MSGRDGRDPSDDPVTRHDVVATIYSLRESPLKLSCPTRGARPHGGPGELIQRVIA